jgi:hypothetical protein
MAHLPASLYKVSWGAICVGVFVGLAAQFLLNLLGVGIGAAVSIPQNMTTPTPAPSPLLAGCGSWLPA